MAETTKVPFAQDQADELLHTHICQSLVVSASFQCCDQNTREKQLDERKVTLGSISQAPQMTVPLIMS